MGKWVKFVRGIKKECLNMAKFFNDTAKWCENLIDPFTPEKKRKIFEELFDEQIDILREFYRKKYLNEKILQDFYMNIKYPIHLYPDQKKRISADIYAEQMIEYFKEQKKIIIKQAMGIEIYEIFIPFMPVIRWEQKIWWEEEIEKEFRNPADRTVVCKKEYIFNYCLKPEKIKFSIPAEKEILKRSSEKWTAYWRLYWPRYRSSKIIE